MNGKNILNESLQHKLKFLKAPLKTWRKENFDSMDYKIFDLESVIHDLERISDDRDLNNMELVRLNAANSLLHKWLIKRERVWRQRARSYGFSLKDHNMKFFHALTIFKQKKKEIIQTNINARVVQGVKNLK